MQLDLMNRITGVKSPAEVLKSCPKCKNANLFKFEGEAFCTKCNWDSVDIHAELLAEAHLANQHQAAKGRAQAELNQLMCVCESPQSFCGPMSF